MRTTSEEESDVGGACRLLQEAKDRVPSTRINTLVQGVDQNIHLGRRLYELEYNLLECTGRDRTFRASKPVMCFYNLIRYIWGVVQQLSQEASKKVSGCLSRLMLIVEIIEDHRDPAARCSMPQRIDYSRSVEVSLKTNQCATDLQTREPFSRSPPPHGTKGH